MAAISWSLNTPTIFYSMFLNLYCARDPLRVLCGLK